GVRRAGGAPVCCAAPMSKVPARSLTLQRFERKAGELLEDVIADGARWREVAHDAAAAHQRLQQRLPPALAARARLRACALGDDDRLATFMAAQDVLGTRPLATLRHGPAFDLHDVEAEVQHGRVGDRGADAV